MEKARARFTSDEVRATVPEMTAFTNPPPKTISTSPATAPSWIAVVPSSLRTAGTPNTPRTR